MAAAAAPATQDPDKVYQYPLAAHKKLCDAKPWKADPHYFKRARISATAAMKMVMHAQSGKDLEVMGLLQGYIEEGTFMGMDTFALPVEGTETRVNAGNEASEYMFKYLELIKQVGLPDFCVGWYHSHPGYGCWLSGIDVTTQMTNQAYSEPFLAIVVDPKRTINSGKVELGAFRTYPKDYKPPDEGPSEYQTIPLDKIADFGVHCKSYYPLDVQYFKSTLDSHLLDLLWNKYWVNTLSSSPLIANREYTARQIRDLSDKLEQAETQLTHSSRMGGFVTAAAVQEKKKDESQLSKITKDGVRTSTEQVHGLMSQVMKDILFNLHPPK